MRPPIEALLVQGALAGALLTGCAGQSDVAADCALAIRHEGTTYVEHGFTSRPATRTGQADDAECDDTGTEPKGAWFPEDPRRVDVWTFDGHDPDEVLGVREPDGTFRFFVAEGVNARPIIRSLQR
jgi:hypothetical protein